MSTTTIIAASLSRVCPTMTTTTPTTTRTAGGAGAITTGSARRTDEFRSGLDRTASRGRPRREAATLQSAASCEQGGGPLLRLRQPHPPDRGNVDLRRQKPTLCG